MMPYSVVASYLATPVRRTFVSTAAAENSRLLRLPQSASSVSHLGLLSRMAVAAGAAAVALSDPSRGDAVALATELTSSRALLAVRARVAAAPGGAALLSARPARLSGSDGGGADASLVALAALPPSTLGGAYARFMAVHALEAGDRASVRALPTSGAGAAVDAELAWLLQRARDAHDVWHVLTGLPPSLLGELTLKAFEAAHLRLPAAAVAAAAAPLRLPPQARAAYLRVGLPWALRAGARARPLLAVNYEVMWTETLEDVRALLRVEPAPAALA